MDSLAVLMKTGLIKMTWGTEENSSYEIESPTFDSAESSLDQNHFRGKAFTRTTENNTNLNIQVKSSILNGEKIEGFSNSHSQITGGGELLLQMIKYNH